MKRWLRPALIVVAAIAAAGLLAFLTLRSSSPKPEEYRLDQVESAVDAGQVSSVKILDRDNSVSGTLQDGTKFVATYPKGYATDLATRMRSHPEIDVTVDSQREPLWRSTLVGFAQLMLPLVLVGLGLWYFFIAPTQGGSGRRPAFGRARGRKMQKDEPKTTFADIAGLDEAVEELAEIRDFLESPERFQELGAKVPRGILLCGPPGTGKTLLARAVAGEADVPFFSISGSDFVEMFVGVGASRIRDLFDQAKSDAPAIIFIDEIDAVGRHRGAGLGGGHDEREQTLNQLLVEMDGFNQRSGVVMMGATNRPDILDPALLRPGRFDRQVDVDLPDLEGRRGILAVHAKGKPLDQSVDLDIIARRTPGFTGADLANLVNEAALLAARTGSKAVSMVEMDEAIDRVLTGPEKKTRIISDHEKKVIAYHESGHALVGHVLPNAHPIHKISIIPRGRAMGYTLALPETDRYLVTRSELRDQLTMLLGGRVAEEMIFEEPTTGAQDDLQKATEVARQMVSEYGMSDTFGPISLGPKSHEVFLGRDYSASPEYSDSVAAEIDSEVRSMVEGAHVEAAEILRLHRDVLDKLASELIAKETLDTDEVLGVLSELPTWQSVTDPAGRPGIRPGEMGGNGDRRSGDDRERTQDQSEEGRP